jgi:DNA-binding NarL/FixJ family response regulator
MGAQKMAKRKTVAFPKCPPLCLPILKIQPYTAVKSQDKQTAMQNDCPLTPALLRLLQASVSLGTTNNKEIANALNCPEETIKSMFYRINTILGTHSRSEAILKAIAHKWVQVIQENAPI